MCQVSKNIRCKIQINRNWRNERIRMSDVNSVCSDHRSNIVVMNERAAFLQDKNMVFSKNCMQEVSFPLCTKIITTNQSLFGWDVLCLLAHKSTTNAEQIEQVEKGVITGLLMVIPTKAFRLKSATINALNFLNQCGIRLHSQDN